MATYNTADNYSAATFDDILINAYGERGRIIGETPNGTAWLVQSERFDHVRRVMFKDSPELRARAIVARDI